MTPKALISRVNGRDCQQLSLFDRGFQFGDSLFETARFYQGQCPLWSLHIDRLRKGCDRLDIDFPIEIVNSEYQYLCETLVSLKKTDAIVKLQLSRGESLRGYGAAKGCSNLVSLAFDADPFSADFSAQKGNAVSGLNLEISSVRLAQQPLLAGIKHGNRLEQVMARRRLNPGFDDALLMDTQSYIVEAISSNVFFYYNDCWYTPALTQAGVAGIVREVLLKNKAVIVADFDVTADTLFNSESVYLANSVQGILPVSRLCDEVDGVVVERAWQDFSGWKNLSQTYCKQFTQPKN